MKYEKCLTCADLGSACDGPNFLAMETTEMGQWCNQKRKQLPGMTYDKIAAETGISKSTVHGFLNGTHSDYRIETIRQIVKLITGGKWDDNACGNLSNSEKVHYEEQARHLETEIKWRDDKIKHILTENENLRSSVADTMQLNKENYEFIKRKNRIIALLGGLLAVSLLVIITALVVDSLNPNIGFFWLKE